MDSKRIWGDGFLPQYRQRQLDLNELYRRAFDGDEDAMNEIAKHVARRLKEGAWQDGTEAD